MTPSLPEGRLSRLKVLLVEDEDVTREMMRDFCARCDMPVDCTAMGSGLEALVDISSIMPDVLIADLNMSGVDGFELLRTLRQNPLFSKMTCLVISALTPEEIESRGNLPEGTIFFAKPVNLQWLTGLMAGRQTYPGKKNDWRRPINAPATAVILWLLQWACHEPDPLGHPGIFAEHRHRSLDRAPARPTGLQFVGRDWQPQYGGAQPSQRPVH